MPSAGRFHPPGGATALTAVLGGSAIHEMGFRYVIFPVLVNRLLMIGVAVVFNVFFGWRRYPAFLGHKDVPPLPGTPSHDEIVEALRSINTFVDVSEDDLILLSQLLARGQEVPVNGGRNERLNPQGASTAIKKVPSSYQDTKI